MEIAMTIGKKIVEYTVAPIGRQLGYLFFYNNNVAKLKEKVENLGHMKERLQHSIDEAIRKGEEIEEDVKKWLKTKDGITVKANKLIEEASEAMTSYSNWSCPNLKSRHQLSRKASKMVMVVSKIEEEGNSFHAKGVSYHVPPQGIGNTFVKGYEAFESRMSTLRGVIKALKSDNINTIGVYGMGGVGKTMLVNEVARKVKQDNLFDKVVMTVVSQTLDFKKMQGEIADILGLKFDVESTKGRADKLQERLKIEKNILVIIDDIWEQLDLEAIGISFGNDQKKCKLLFTSRFEDVLCNDMGIQKNFYLGVLWDDEARNLFRKIVGSLTKDQDFDLVAVEVVKECAGLPIAITIVANALKNRGLPVWKDAVQQLRTSNPTNIKGMSDKVYHSIELSYNFLRSEEAKSLLLLCSLYKEDANINVDSLFKYCVGLDLFQDVNRLEAVRNRVYTLVEILKSSCLLLNGDRDDTVKMHDVIRDVAIHIAAKDKRMLVIGNDVNLQEQSMKEKLKDSTAISLPYTDVCELPERLECPQLKLFLLFNKNSSLQIPHPFFEGMKKLRVLNLTGMPCRILLSSLSFLQNLQTLCLNSCELEDVSLIGELKELKVLSLAYTNIKQLPEQIRKLTHLKVLDLYCCYDLKVIPPNILSNLKMLEELYMKNSFTGWEVEGQSSEGSNARVTELDHLSWLTTLEIDIPRTKILPKALIFEKLVRYKISIGYCSREYLLFKTSTALELKLDISFQSVDGIGILLKSCKELYLGELKGVQNILYELNSDGFSLLKCLNIENNDEIQYIINSMGPPAFPILESINLYKVKNLENICHGLLAVGSFRNLREVQVVNCNKLKSIFSSSMAGCLPQLQQIYISGCEVMGSIVGTEKEDEIEISTNGTMKFPQLRSLDLYNLPKLIDVESPGILFNQKVALPNLEIMKISRLDNLRMIWHHQLVPNSFCKLKELVVEYESLKSVFPVSVANHLIQQLERLEINNCRVLEDIIAKEKGLETEPKQFVFPRLTKLSLCILHELKSFYPGKYTLDCPSLKVLEIKDCNNIKMIFALDSEVSFQQTNGLGHGDITIQQPLFWIKKDTFANLEDLTVDRCTGLKNLLSSSTAKSLVQLRKMSISFCLNITEIVGNEGGECDAGDHPEIVFNQLTSLELKDLPILTSFHLGNCTIIFPSLNRVEVTNCPELKIFSQGVLSMPTLSTFRIKGRDGQFYPINEKDDLNILYELNSDGFPLLKHLEIKNNFEIQYIINLMGPPRTRSIAFPVLESINLCNVINLKNICHGVLAVGSFRNLREVEVVGCHNMKFVFSSSAAAGCFPQLQKIRISRCKVMGSIVGREREDEIEISNNCTMEFPQLRSLHLESLPELTCCFGFDEKVALPSLEVPNSFCKLKKLVVKECESLKSLFSASLAKHLIQLEELEIWDCGVLEDIVAKEEGLSDTEPKKFVFPRLTELQLIRLPKLKGFYPGKYTLDCPSLKMLKILNCGIAKMFSSDSEDTFANLLSSSTAKSLVQLREMSISYCKNITEIVGNEGGECDAGDDLEIVFNQLTSLEFQFLPKLTSFHPGNCTMIFPSLTKVVIQGCSELKIFSQGVLSTPTLSTLVIDWQTTTFYPEKDNLNNCIKQAWGKCNQKNDQKFEESRTGSDCESISGE